MPTAMKQNEDGPSPLQIEEALSQILLSTPFHGSKQCQTLLRYLVEHSLKGHDDELKERIIGIEVFGRKSDYDTSEDAIVRARVGEVRKRLAQYYTSDEGQDVAVRIVIAPGAYRPTFIAQPEGNRRSQGGSVKEPREPGAIPDAIESPKHEIGIISVPNPGPRLPRTARWRSWGIGALAACAILSVAWIGIRQWTTSGFDIFWAPILDSKKPVVIYTGTAPVYVRSMDIFYKEMSHLKPGEEKQPAPRWSLPPLEEGDVLTSNDVLVEPDGYIEVGDVTAVVNVTGLLNSHHRSFDLRMGPDLAFEDLHGVPTILVGSYANSWTMAMSSDLRFYFDRNLDVRERGGQGRVWSISHGADRARSSTIAEDYAIVCRLFDSKTGAPVITLAGTTTCGARAASEFVTDPVRMRKLESIPRSAWERKNLELVLHTSLINCNPTAVDIVAMDSW
jgi:hypothetical protein